MHILLIHQAFVEIDEAGGTRHHELACYLAERGHRVTIIASPVSYLTGKADNTASRRKQSGPGGRVTIWRTYTYKALHRSFIHRVFSFISFMASSFLAGLSVSEVDLVWGTSPPIFQGLTAWALARLKRATFLFEVRDLWPAFAIEVGVLRNPLLIRLSNWLERFLYRHADRVMVNSPGFIQHVQDRGARQVELIPNGTDPRMFDPSADGVLFRQQYGLAGKYVALYAGAHGMSNDLGVALQAAQLLADRPEIAVVLVGDGKEKPALQSQATALGLTNVHFIPPVAKSQMGEVLAAADACIAILKPVPMYATVYPNKVFDYLAAARPVILAIDGVIREVVEKANAGVFVPPGDPQALAEAISYLAAQRGRGREMGLNGRHYLEQHFDRASLAEKLALLLERMNEN
ncbi:MAG: glycosyltransferase family 4 protein [Anaerolineales bacterium]|nr:glycosyltransferase family 4 protein [Anaerolineales bacterium]